MRTRFIAALTVLVAGLAPFSNGVAAQAHSVQAPAGTAADTSVHLDITLDRPDWRYHPGDSALFHLTSGGAGTRYPTRWYKSSSVLTECRRLGGRYCRYRAVGADVERDAARARIRAADRDRGPRRRAATRRAGPRRSIRRRSSPATPMPNGFMEFWRSAIASARKMPLDVRMTRLAARSTPEVDVYHISFQNDRAGSRIYGCSPCRPGPGSIRRS